MRRRILIASQPTKGLDVGYTEFVRRKLLELRERMIGTLIISEDLDEIMQLSDRIAVMYRGEIMGIVDAKEATIDDILPSLITHLTSYSLIIILSASNSPYLVILNCLVRVNLTPLIVFFTCFSCSSIQKYREIHFFSLEFT